MKMSDWVRFVFTYCVLAFWTATGHAEPQEQPEQKPVESGVPAKSSEPGKPAATLVSPLDTAARQRIIKAVTDAAKQTRFRGAVLVAHRGEAVVMSGFGVRIPSAPSGSPGNRPIDGSSIFEIASISKPFTAMAIVQLADAGRITLDDPVAKWLKDDLPEKHNLGGITLRHLLSHTTGLDNDTGISPYPEPSRSAAVKKFAASKGLAKPGTTFNYNNAAYCMLAVVIEKASGTSFEQHMQDKVFAPAGMKSTGFPPGTTLDIKQVVRRKDRFTMNEHPWGWGYRGCGGILTSLADLLAWEKAIAEERLLPAASRELMYTPVIMADSRAGEAHYALGWFVGTCADGRRRVFHSGGSFGVRASLVRHPDESVLIVALTDDTADPNAMVKAAERAVLADVPRAKGK